MSFRSLPQRWVNAAAVFIRLRLVSQYADASWQNREPIYRDAPRVNQELEEGAALRSELQGKVEKLTAENAKLRHKLNTIRLSIQTRLPSTLLKLKPRETVCLWRSDF